MEQDILSRISELGGNVNHSQEKTLVGILLNVTFDTVLYRRPKDTPWQHKHETEPIAGMDKFIMDNDKLFKQNEAEAFDKLIAHFFSLTEEPHGQFFWSPRLFTPFTEGTADYEIWNEELSETQINLPGIFPSINTSTPEFLQLFYSYGYPDHYYVSINDNNFDNPVVLGTDHESFFDEVTNESNLHDFLSSFMTKDEVIERTKRRMGE